VRRPVRIGLIGTGKMARAHGQAYLTAARFFELPVEPRLAVVCGSRERAEAVARAFGWEEVAADWRRVVERRDLDLIDVCTPTGSHAEIVVAAAGAGRAVLCEKPLASSGGEAEAVVRAAAAAGVSGAVVFNYRYVPAIRQARDLIAGGRLGELRHLEFHFLQDWLTDAGRPMSWRLRAAEGGGVVLDLGSHLVDLVQYLVGPVGQVAAILSRSVAERADERGEPQPVDVEDHFHALVEVAGVPGTLAASRVASGDRCGFGFQIHGSRGSLRWDFQRLNDLELYLDDQPALQGWRRISVTRPGAHPWADAWWGAGHGLGYEETFVHLMTALLRRLGGEQAEVPTLEDGLRCQRVLDAMVAAARSRAWVAV
jgi:predicted dehydrogenase